ncbi:unnamed protein product [Rotaria socialis]|uniref:MULE transposase domain-containing protein n=1 Tax=Rotaria socialis TaxID=392032 RepID=A0A821TAB4_9BILA|nr:unnamed protein product [Rotaria socialis]
MTSTANSLSFLVSSKGKVLLVLNDFVYRLKKQTKDKKYWICQESVRTAYVDTNIDNIFKKSSGDHNHLCEPEVVKVKQFRSKLKNRAVQETTAIAKIYEEEIIKSRLSTRTLATLPLVQELQPGLLYARRQLRPVLPSSSSFEIPDSYQVTLTKEIFLFSDTLVGRRKRMLLFGSITQLEMLFDCTTIFMDGAFSCTPPFFDQVFTIHALKFETSFPCVFGILSDRKRITYQELFKILKDFAISINRKFEPTRILSDFESGLISAIANEFSAAVHNGCFFHYTQAIFRRIRALGLTTLYFQNSEIRSCCRKLMALALLPIDKIESSFHSLRVKSSTMVNQELHQLFLYFNHQWLVNIPLKIWNVYGCHHRTNNNCEGFHNRLNQRIQKSHPNIWMFIKLLQTEECRFRHLLLQMNAGAQARKKVPVANMIQKRIDTLYDRYNGDEMDVDQLLDGLSLTIAKQKRQ